MLIGCLPSPNPISSGEKTALYDDQASPPNSNWLKREIELLSNGWRAIGFCSDSLAFHYDVRG